MHKTFGWGILGPGRIATRFVSDLRKLGDARRVAVASRDVERARAFAAQHGFARAHGSYEELVRDPEVDAIYVATPHPFHAEHACLCLEHGKAVLCEKPFAVNARQAREMAACAHANGVFLMEAMWTRFGPVMTQVRRWLQEGAIGEVRLLVSDFGFRAQVNPEARLFSLDLAGGAVLDVGAYVVSLASMIYGAKPQTVQATAHLGETGVDEQTAMTFGYAGGALAQLYCAVRTNTIHQAQIYGTEGAIYVPFFWNATQATLAVAGRDPVQVTGEMGFHHEAAEVMACVRAGRTESAIMPLDESIAIIETMDQVRALIGLRYPID
jgi:predicted dehydrogenase